MHQETLTYQADGLTMRSQLTFEPAAGPRAGVLVFPEAFGLDAHAIRRAERLAALGYVAIACDLHGEGRVIDDLQEAMTQLQPLFKDPARLWPHGPQLHQRRGGKAQYAGGDPI